MTSVDILMNEDIFPNPTEFQPERWINRPDLDRYFVPFGKGSRQCLGIKYGQLAPFEAFIVVYVG
jgi:cytochrome P450